MKKAKIRRRLALSLYLSRFQRIECGDDDENDTLANRTNRTHCARNSSGAIKKNISTVNEREFRRHFVSATVVCA